MLQQTPNIIAGIDIGSNTTRVIITEHMNNGNPPRVIGVGRAETSGVTKGFVINPDEVSRSIIKAVRMAERMADISLERAYVCIQGTSLQTHAGSAVVQPQKKEISERDIAALQEIAIHQFYEHEKNRTVLHVIPLVYTLDNEELSSQPVGLSGTVLSAQFSIVSCLEQHKDNLINAISKTNIDIVDIIASPVAASVLTLSKRSRAAGAGLIDIGLDTLTISIFEHDALIHMTTISCGSNLITNDLALGLQITLEEAELLKLGKKQPEKNMVSKRKILDITEARVMDMMEVVQKKLIQWNKNGLLPGGLTIIGGGSHTENMETYARTFLKLPVQIPSAEKMIPCKKVLDNGWFAVYGLCMLGDQKPHYRATGMNIKKIAKDTRNILRDFFEQFLP